MYHVHVRKPQRGGERKLHKISMYTRKQRDDLFYDGVRP